MAKRKLTTRILQTPSPEMQRMIDAPVSAGEQLDMGRQGGFNPDLQPLEMNKAEKLRTTALLMAINYVRDTICNDAEMYRTLRQDGKQLVPATVPWVLSCSIDFEKFLKGEYSGLVQPSVDAPDRPIPDAEQSAQDAKTD